MIKQDPNAYTEIRFATPYVFFFFFVPSLVQVMVLRNGRWIGAFLGVDVRVFQDSHHEYS